MLFALFLAFLEYSSAITRMTSERPSGIEQKQQRCTNQCTHLLLTSTVSLFFQALFQLVQNLTFRICCTACVRQFHWISVTATGQQLEMERTSLARIKQTEIFKSHPPLVNAAAAQRVTLHWTARHCFYTRLKLRLRLRPLTNRFSKSD